MQLPTLPRSGDEQGYLNVVLGFRTLLGSDKLAQPGLAVADAHVPSAACLVPNPAAPEPSPLFFRDLCQAQSRP